MSRPAPVVVSGCLAGLPCRWDGTARPLEGLEERLDGAEALPLCPEELAGFGTPRPSIIWQGGDGRAALAGRALVVRQTDGADVTPQLLRGAQEALRLAMAAGCRRALLKERSPSCGVWQIHTHTGLMAGCGLFAALLEERGVLLETEELRSCPAKTQ